MSLQTAFLLSYHHPTLTLSNLRPNKALRPLGAVIRNIRHNDLPLLTLGGGPESLGAFPPHDTLHCVPAVGGEFGDGPGDEAFGGPGFLDEGHVGCGVVFPIEGFDG